jgi:mono/diheme cytochrome c family protein
MPPYGELLGHEAVNSLLDLIFREFIRIKRDDKRSDLMVPPRPAVILGPEKTGKVYAKQCSSCHGVAGNGKGPEYLKYLPRPRDLTNRPYFKSLSDERIAMAIFYGVPSTAMGPFLNKISPESVWSLVNKIREISDSHGEAGKSNG